ncbi:hypothetical protein MSIMFB_03229 [Mycobacterium simulans]|uniref:Uncharacterized protein n=1 Tax=Mycobacterium simulans TaxID=627089 RepID=A0A7Z7INM0_9MYCO|nr:hypothetical protein MSIMFB_03229 [Mycobacterium simulans]
MAMGMQLRQRTSQRVQVRAVTMASSDHGAGAGVGDGGSQHGVGGQLKEGVGGTGGQESGHTVGEAHGVAQVLGPVVR